MKQLIDIQNWHRKDQFAFFNRFEEPFFGVTVQVSCGHAYAFAKANKLSFFQYYLHKSLQAANAIESFRLRIQDEQVYVYDTVHASPTINRPDGTFGFSYINYHPNFNQFSQAAQVEIDKVQNSTGLIPAVSGENVIHYSSIPWLHFTSLSHARSFSFKDSIPKISFGKMIDQNGDKIMPMSVHVHHALMDGFHVAAYVDLFQELMSSE